MNSIIMNFDNSSDINTAFIQLKKQYPKVKISRATIDFEELEDEKLLALALERIKNDNGVRYTEEEILAEDGLTVADIDRMLEEEDIELE